MTTESVSEGKLVVSSAREPEPVKEKICERRTTVYETRIEPTVIENIAEKIKAQFFTRLGFITPPAEQIQLVSIDKFYEPYIKIAGRYTIDYYRKATYNVEVDSKVNEVIIAERSYRPTTVKQADIYRGTYGMIDLEAEERITSKLKASLILDKLGQEVSPKSLATAPREKNPTEILEAFEIKEPKADEDLKIIRARIHRRPQDIYRLVSETFEVTERELIYAPRFRLVYTNVRTGEAKAIEFDGVTTERIQKPLPLRQSQIPGNQK